MLNRGFSIKTKITLPLVLLPLISLLTVGTLALIQNQNSLAEQAEHNIQRILAEKTRAYNHIFERIEREVQAVAGFTESLYLQKLPKIDLERRMLLPWTGEGYGSDEIRESLRGDIIRLQRVGETLQAIVNNNTYLTLGYLATESGITVFNDEATVGIIEELEAFDPRVRPWYKQAKEKKASVWTEPYVDANTKKLTVTAASPAYSASNRLLGVAGFDVLLETLQNDIISMDIGYKNDPFMINDRGFVILRPGMEEENTEWDKTYKTDNLLETDDPAFNQIIAKMVSREQGIELYESLEGGKNYLAFAPIDAIGSSVGIVVPRSEVVRPVQESGKLIILALAIIIIIALGIGLTLGNQVTNPIEELTLLVDKVSRGLVEVEEIPIKRRDEIGVLAGSFNRMVSNLSSVLRKLEERERI